MLRLQGSVREMALDVVRADGGRFPVVVNAVLESGPDGVPLVVRVAMFDATERRQYERELVLARRTAEEAESRALALARTLQQTLIPPHPPRIPGLEVAAAYRPAGDGAEVGGDFYDVFQAGDDEWVVVLGDVSGKGVDAAVVTSLIRYTVRGIAARVADPSEVLRELNEVLLAHDTDRFCTLAMLRLAPGESGLAGRGELRGPPAGAGAPPPTAPCRLLGSSGSLVGVFDDVAFTTSRRGPGPGRHAGPPHRRRDRRRRTTTVPSARSARSRGWRRSGPTPCRSPATSWPRWSPSSTACPATTSRCSR